ncbi:hypothetical protein G6F42_024895 [Rhizopus arrhizus]|nr:hypothetical protein G6F42_024895 [Rhizopus arrhizus]
MNVRIVPCTECRRNRRKCVRPSLSPECVRCKKLGKICKQPTKQESQQEPPETSKSQDIIKLEEQVLQLEEAIHYMEQQLSMYRSGRKTGIRNINELLQFNTSISYLSPLNYDSSSSVSSDDSYYRGRDAGIVLNFEKEVNGSLIPFTITLMAKTITSAPSHIPVALLIPSALLLDPKSLCMRNRIETNWLPFKIR